MKKITAKVLIFTFLLHTLQFPYFCFAQDKSIKGEIKKFITKEKVTVRLEESGGIKAGDMLFVMQDGQKIAEIKVLKHGKDWLIGLIVKKEEGKTIQVGDSVTDEVISVAKEEEKKEDVVIGTKEEILEEKEEKKTESVDVQTAKKIKQRIAIVSIENKTNMKDEKLSLKALDSLTYYLVKQGKYDAIEREKIDKVLAELISKGILKMLSEPEVMNEEILKEIGKLSGGDIIVVGSINSITSAGKPKAYFAELHIRAVDVGTGKIVFALKSRGASGKFEGNEETLVTKALDNAAEILVKKLPVKIKEIRISGMVVVGFGKKDGIKVNDELPVIRKGEEIGKLKIQAVHEETAEGIFSPLKEGTILDESDEVLNTKVADAQLPKAKKSMSKLLLYGGLGLVLIIILLSGGKKETTVTPPHVPPAPPSPRY